MKTQTHAHQSFKIKCGCGNNEALEILDTDNKYLDNYLFDLAEEKKNFCYSSNVKHTQHYVEEVICPECLSSYKYEINVDLDVLLDSREKNELVKGVSVEPIGEVLSYTLAKDIYGKELEISKFYDGDFISLQDGVYDSSIYSIEVKDNQVISRYNRKIDFDQLELTL